MKKMKILKKEDENLYNTFSDYMSKEALDKLKKGKIPGVTDELEEGLITYIIIQIKEFSYPKNIELISDIVEIISKNNGFISNILPCFVLATFGFPFEDNTGIPSCEKTVSDIIEKFTIKIKIVYGSEHGVYMNVGTTKIISFIPLIPNFSQKIDFLLRLKFGKIREIK